MPPPAEKFFFETPPPPLSQGLDDQASSLSKGLDPPLLSISWYGIGRTPRVAPCLSLLSLVPS